MTAPKTSWRRIRCTVERRCREARRRCRGRSTPASSTASPRGRGAYRCSAPGQRPRTTTSSPEPRAWARSPRRRHDPRGHELHAHGIEPAALTRDVHPTEERRLSYAPAAAARPPGCHPERRDRRPTIPLRDHPRRSGAGDPQMGARWVHSRQRSRQARPAGAAAPARGSTKREDKDSLTVGSRTAVRRLGCRGEDKDSPEFLIFPRSTTRRPGGRGARSPRVRRAPRAMSAFSPLIDPEAERATGGMGMVTSR